MTLYNYKYIIYICEVEAKQTGEAVGYSTMLIYYELYKLYKTWSSCINEDKKMDKSALKIEEKVHNYIRQNHMFDNCEHIVAGVSGGADSVCLLLMLCEYIKKYQTDICIHAVHVNHMIRQEAVKDEKFTQELCERMGVDCQAEHIDCLGIAKERGLTVEEAGRIERYRIFADVAGRCTGNVMIAVAHHMNDQAETILMNMARGTSLRGIRGIVPVRDNICRPLLGITRSEIENYLTLRGQSYVTDVTNYDNDYTRNAIRNIIIPYMCGNINKRTVENISSMAADIRETQDYMDRQADKLYEECVKADADKNILRLSVDSLKKSDMVLVKRVIHRCLVELAEKAKDIYSVNVSDIAALMYMQTGKVIHSVYGIHGIREYEYIVLKKNVMQDETKQMVSKIAVDISPLKKMYASKKEELVSCALSPAITVDINKKIYTSDAGEIFAESVIFKLIDKKTFLDDKRNIEDKGKNCINNSNYVYAKYYDYDKINKLLDIRFRNSQDDIVISKNGSVKKLKKELIDRKIPSEHREKVLLVCDRNHVLWACGVRRCESYLVEETTKSVLEVSIKVKERN